MYPYSKLLNTTIVLLDWSACSKKALFRKLGIHGPMRHEKFKFNLELFRKDEFLIASEIAGQTTM